MRIHKNLKWASAYNPTKQTFMMSTVNLCQKIETNEITLPLYQRDVVWTLQKSIDLLNYQLCGKAPVSPISVNKITNLNSGYVAQVSLIDREVVEDVKVGQLTIADGQQRLTTNYKAYSNHSDFRNVVLDLAKGKFRIIEGAFRKFHIPVGVLLNSDSDVFYSYLDEHPHLKKSEPMSILVQVRSKLRDYNYTINLAEDLTEDEQVEWFEVLNNAGSRVTKIQMSFSKLKLEGIDIYTQYTKPYRLKLEERGWDLFDVKSTEVSMPIANLNCAYELITKKRHSLNYAPIPSDTKEKQLCSLSASELKVCFEKTLYGLDLALEFIEKNNLKAPSRLDFITYLTGYFVFNEKIDITEKNDELVDWYNGAKFTNKSNGARREMFDKLINI